MRNLRLKIEDQDTQSGVPHRPQEEFAPFVLSPGAVRTVRMEDNPDAEARLWEALLAEAQARKAAASADRTLAPQQIEALAREAYAAAVERSHREGLRLPESFLARLIGELSGLGGLFELIARPGVEDIAVNLAHIYVYTTGGGWEYAGEAPPGIGDALRVLIDRAGQRAPTPDFPVADAMLQVMVPATDGTAERIGLRVNYIMPPASPYGDLITLRVSRYRAGETAGLEQLCLARLPAAVHQTFRPRAYPAGDGLLTPAAANYLLSVMVHGGTLVVAGTTGSGKTFIAQRILQETLDCHDRGRIRLFVIEDANELVLNRWSGDPAADTGNVVYTVTRSEVRGGPPPVTMYDLIRAALRARPHGIIIGEARGAEAWELVRAAATGHGYSAFTLHATGAEQVWARFYQVVQAHPDAQRLQDYQIAQSFAEAVCAVVYVERNPVEGQVIREIAEVSTVVEKSAGRPAFSPLFVRPHGGPLAPTGNRPARSGYRLPDLGLTEELFR